MKTVIFCGGQGTRLREETEFRPKPLVEVGGRPDIVAHYEALSAFWLRRFRADFGLSRRHDQGLFFEL